MSRSAQRWRERLEAFVARKVRAASDAQLSPYVTEVDEPEPHMARICSRWSSQLFDGAFYVSAVTEAGRPASSLVFVQSADGNTGGEDPAVLGGGATDKHLIYEGLSRVLADAVLAGANTVRGVDLLFSVWHPNLVALRASLGLPRHPAQVVATRHGVDIADTLLFNVPDVAAVVLTGARAADTMREAVAQRPWVTMVVMNRADDLAAAFEALRVSGVTRLSCVGGRHLARQCLERGLVDDLYLTTSAQPGGEPDTPLHPRGVTGRTIVRKHGTGPETGVVFEHVARPRPRG